MNPLTYTASPHVQLFMNSNIALTQNNALNMAFYLDKKAALKRASVLMTK